MIFRIEIENNIDRFTAWSLDHPSCFAYGSNSEEAERNFPLVAREYTAWIGRHQDPWLEEEVEVVVEETFEAYFIDSSFERVDEGKDTYMVESFFSLKMAMTCLPIHSNGCPSSGNTSRHCCPRWMACTRSWTSRARSGALARCCGGPSGTNAITRNISVSCYHKVTSGGGPSGGREAFSSGTNCRLEKVCFRPLWAFGLGHVTVAVGKSLCER